MDKNGACQLGGIGSASGKVSFRGFEHQILVDIGEVQIEDNGKKGRFVIYEDGAVAGEMTFTWAGTSRFIIDHTGVEAAYGGKGYGRKMLLEAVAYARAQGVKILPLCPFARAEIERLAEIQDVLA